MASPIALQFTTATTYFDATKIELTRDNTVLELKKSAILSDDFNSGYVAANWPIVTETGAGYATWQNNRVEVKGSTAWAANGFVSKALSWGIGNYITYDVTDAWSSQNILSGFSAAQNLVIAGIRGHIVSANKSYTWIGSAKGTDIATAAGSAINVKIECVARTSTNLNEYRVSIKYGIYDEYIVLGTAVGGNDDTIYFSFQNYSGNVAYIDNVIWYGEYADDNPQAYIKVDSGKDGHTWDMSSSDINENPNSEAGSQAYKCFMTNTDLDVDVSGDRTTIDTGLNASWLTQTNFRLESDQTGRYCYLVPRFTSDGTQQSAIADGALMDVTPDAGSTECTGFDPSEATLGAQLELAAEDSEIIQSGFDYLSAGKNIVLWANYASGRNPTYDAGGETLYAFIKGSGGSVAGGVYDTGGAEYTAYTLPEDFDMGVETMFIRFRPNWTGNPASNQIVMYDTNSTGLSGRNVVSIFIQTDGKVIVNIYNNEGTLVAQLTATAAEVNDGATWDQSESVYIAVTIDRTIDTSQLYCGLVSDGTAGRCDSDATTTGITSTSGGGCMSIGGVNRGLFEFWGDIDVLEWALIDGVISTAASFAIPAEIVEIFETTPTSADVATGQEIYLGSVAVETDMSALVLTVGNAASGLYSYSAHDTSGSQSWSAYMTWANILAEANPTSKYFQMRIKLDSADGVTAMSVYETANFHPSGSAGTAAPDEPTDLVWTDNEDGETGDLDLTIDTDSTLTTIEFRRENTTTYSTQTTTDTGSATVTLSGLSVGFYEVRAYSEISETYSLPSDMIRCQVSESTLAASDNQILIDFGEEIKYSPKTGGDRRIWAVVDRNPSVPIGGGLGGDAKHLIIQVDNSDTTGISTDEVNCGYDEVIIDERQSSTAIEMRIVEVLIQDGDGNMAHYKVM